MKILPAVISLSFVLSSACWAATPVTQGVIRFEGRIVEQSCATGTDEAVGIWLNDCPASMRATVLEARNVDSSSAAPSIKVALLWDSGHGRYYDQQYQLVDVAGSPVKAGNYLITMSLP
ncbi:type 1 fimbrial protein [Pseudomonas entomophila]|uniref:type 1 fimbrial protein n=1 Tax=Pseudomonas entomophila TaxID=312306 RepID=UPI002404C566|nr:type 1 fimbrial protein [Pseudomonas entomophila]MDF9620558.1 type 1 fimbrial protein [Pseudomonas entomophila]